MRRVADKCYLPTNEVFLNLIKEYGHRVRIAYSISGVALKQFEMYAPEVLDSFKRLADTGCVEFIAETYSHSLAALKSRDEFKSQVDMQVDLVQKHFGVKPVTFRNTELIYSDQIGEMVADMGYKVMLTEGAKHVLGWKSPNFVYCNAINPKLRLLLKNFRMSDDIAFRFSQQSWPEWPLTTEKWVNWLNAVPQNEEVVNLFMDYETFGEHQWPETGIFEFLRHLPGRIFGHSDFEFLTPSQVAEKHNPIAPIHVPYPISWADEERDLTAWLGNELQDEAFGSLYALENVMKNCQDQVLIRDWKYLQTSDHFYYMCTKFFADGDVHKYFNPYNTPYDAFINFMNALSDFKLRIESNAGIHLPENGKTESRLAPKPAKSVAPETTPKQQVVETQPKTVVVSKGRKVIINDITDFRDADVKRVIKTAGQDTVVVAVKGLSNKIKMKFFSNMRDQTAKKLEKRMHEMTKIPREEVDAARRKVEGAMQVVA